MIDFANMYINPSHGVFMNRFILADILQAFTANNTIVERSNPRHIRTSSDKAGCVEELARLHVQ